jgi:hypothetical protein
VLWHASQCKRAKWPLHCSWHVQVEDFDLPVVGNMGRQLPWGNRRRSPLVVKIPLKHVSRADRGKGIATPEAWGGRLYFKFHKVLHCLFTRRSIPPKATFKF